MPDSPLARVEWEVDHAEATGESQHAAVGGGGAEEFTPDEEVSGNVVGRTGFRRGDVDCALAASDDVVVEGRFSTSWVHQGYIEPQVAMAELDRDGVLHLTSATQGTFWTRSELSRLFGLPIARIRVTGATLGGGFGGKLLIQIRWRLQPRCCSVARSGSSSPVTRTSGWPTRRQRRSSR